MVYHFLNRGVSRRTLFDKDQDFLAFERVVEETLRTCRMQICAYCLLSNHILIAVPSSEKGLRWAIGEAHRLDTRRINFREKWRGYLWQGRFASFVMDEAYLLAAARYIELNPLRAGLVADPCDWRWSSARAHLTGKDDALVKVAPLLAMIPDWRAFLNSALPEAELRDIRRHSRTGRPLGDEAFLSRLEGMLGRVLRPKKPGPKSNKALN